ncbi:MAG: hypothetical protein L6V87_00730 [Ruminococcus sp.]|nr:MAG: hypothetical protein L6V87_00730 [Ruminococcus sp.]
MNVSKYAHYLRNFTDTTQFITVTHRRGTMEEADVMYGVTMQEKGHFPTAENGAASCGY